MKPTGQWTWRVHDRDGLLIAEQKFPNGATIVGLNDVLSCYFVGGTQRIAWYLGLIDNTGFVTLAASDSMASHPGWTENTSYAGNRQQWLPNAPAGGLTINANPASFTMSSGGIICGSFIVSDPVKGVGNGILYATGLGAQPQQVSVGQVLTVTYSPILQLGN